MTLAFDFTQSLKVRGNARAYQIGMLALGASLFCLTPLLRSPQQKLVASIPGMAAIAMSLKSGRDHMWADSRVSAFVGAEDGGYRQDLVRTFMGNPGMGKPAQLEAEVVDEFDEPDPFLLGVAQMTDPMAKVICGAMIALDVPVYCDRIEEGLAFNRYYLIPQDGLKANKVLGMGKDLMVAAGLANEPNIEVVAGAIAIDVARNERQLVNYSDYISQGVRPGCQVPIGVDQLTGELVWMDFADSNTPHACFAGSTGSGKSEALRAQIKYAIENHDNTRLLLVDVKASTFSEYSGVDGVTVIENAVHGAISIVEMAAKMEQRRITRQGFKDVADYNKQAEKPLPRVLIYVEELKDMLDGLKTCTPRELEMMGEAASLAFGREIVVDYAGKGAVKPEVLVMMALGRIGQAGRSEAIHLTLITQEPDKKLLDSLIGNLPVKVALRLNSFIETNVILPGKNAHCERLLGKGDLIYSVPGLGLRRLQSLWVG